jgi:fumarate reductase flavoprotein subunit
MTGVSVTIDGSETELIGCRKLILACNGFGGNRDLVARHMPGIAEGLWFGHDGNRGEAVLWGELLGASITHLGAYQGHGNVAHPHGILITWAVITQGGIQVNQQGQRFWDESQGYSEAARVVLAQPGGVAVTLFDERIASIARQFEDFREAETAGAIHRADSLDELARQFSLPVGALLETVKKLPISTSLPSSSADTSPASTSATRSDATETSAGFTDVADEFGRIFKHEPLQAPFYAVRVTGALFHTQGGLMIDTDARVLRTDGTAFPNLFAGGGAACGVSGTGDAGYLSGNGLLSAVVLGYRAGLTAVL